jgi:hypothetical protein
LEEDSGSRRERRREGEKSFSSSNFANFYRAWQVTKGFFKIRPDFCHNPYVVEEDRFITAVQIGLAKLELCRCLLVHVP